MIEEVTINVYPSIVDKYADIYSAIPDWTARLTHLVEAYPDKASIEFIDKDAAVVRLPASWISVAPPEAKEESDGSA